MRVLDLGCGPGRDLGLWQTSDQVVGIDLDQASLSTAKSRFPDRQFLQGRGESLPFPDASFDRVVSNVAVPYMGIQRALAEVRRILSPRGTVFFTLHSYRFTLSELFHNSFPKPIATLFRLYVLLNGLVFHCTGKTMPCLAGRTESFQTERGMRIAFRRAGFNVPTFRRSGTQFIVEAERVSAGGRVESVGAVDDPVLS